jgi:hypothetical protein
MLEFCRGEMLSKESRPFAAMSNFGSVAAVRCFVHEGPMVMHLPILVYVSAQTLAGQSTIKNTEELRIPEHPAGHSDNIRPPKPGYSATLV